MDAYVVEWLSFLGRSLHLIAGIAWIGASFYFIWLDAHLHAPRYGDEAQRLGIGGEVWALHGGGFYRAQKFAVAPPELPEPLHWFKWEAYSTWLSGMFLLGLVYYLGAEVYLIDRSVADLSRPVAIAAGLAFLAGGWVVYDLLCRSPLGAREPLLAALMLALCTLAAYALTHLFSGRGAYIHFGAMLGTIMAGNVLFVIMPAQREMVLAKSEGRVPDPAHAARGKQRSVHNTYFTLPVLFAMLSNHYGWLYSHAQNWLVLILMMFAGAAIRQFFVLRHGYKLGRNGHPWPYALVGVLVLVGTAVWLKPAPSAATPAAPAATAPAAAAPAAAVAASGVPGYEQLGPFFTQHCV
ncbi:MAG TPA: urate hydroxylase PuuD, partial [Casimicrobiaceae bacterium]|nr:urate hydroxylase PuuD [Casimicrobiaceae bacterium]